jgi:divalent metal cation (Fe/Co/Zn/Cd) transporter
MSQTQQTNAQTQGIDLGAIIGAIGEFLVSFFKMLVQHAPLILTVTVAGYLIYRYAGTIRRAISQLIGLL